MARRADCNVVRSQKQAVSRWTVSPTGDLYVTWDVAFGNGTFVAVGSGELIKQSDPVVWLQSLKPGFLEISGPPDVGYSVESRGTLMPNDPWVTLTNLTSTTGPLRWKLPAPSGPESRFYRTVIQQ